MQKIYEAVVAETYEWVAPTNDAHWKLFRNFDGSTRAKDWQPIHVERILRDDEGKMYQRSDFPWLMDSPLVMRAMAVEALRDILQRHGEILPLSTDDGVELYAFNVHAAVDALDEARSDVWRFPNGRIGDIKKPAFFEAQIRDLEIFRLPIRGSSTYVTDTFVNRVHEAGLVGLDFPLVWSSDEQSHADACAELAPSKC